MGNKLFIKICSDQGTTCVYDLNKVSEIFKEGDKTIKIIIDGVKEVWTFASKDNRDKNFEDLEQLLLKLNIN